MVNFGRSVGRLPRILGIGPIVIGTPISNMKVVIIETVHFQYGLTQSEIFEDAERIFFVTQDMHDRMHAYAPGLCKGRFIVIRSVDEAREEIIRTCNEEQVDLLLVSPIYKDFHALYEIVTRVKCESAMTVYNLNFWLNPRFRTLKYYRERKLKQRVFNAFDHIIVEDFLFKHIKKHKTKLFNSHHFLYIPFTIFHPKAVAPSERRDPGILKVVLPGTVNKARRRYEDLLELIHHFAGAKAPISFSFAGSPVGEYGKWVVSELDKANAAHPGIARHYPLEGDITPGMFVREMEDADIVLSTITKVFKDLGTKEYYGTTKSTGTLHDMISFQLPGLLPAILEVPEDLTSSVFNYGSGKELGKILQQLMDKPSILREWQANAQVNSTCFTAPEVRRNLPFFGNTCKTCGKDARTSPGLWLDKEWNCETCRRELGITSLEDQFSGAQSVGI